ncbi:MULTISPECIES: transcription termination factor NusA [Myroides]|uniref:Transcription termination/antitermination protein NusA n=1 Tax=Myroides albus TaxID=2562892 RepID=A0A6I3LG03_9FLAO|nr:MULTISPECIES: transcription termination factor NusA [Myroides]MTG96734.1 transcription termination/antitermination protein NusA [Myroides albus]MVX35624.1 transcription termination/antitermination protein NusA [Myroides sp. LoEW2-1]UVD80854.1 transcription termination factor NusA [Myroides albus]
MENRDLVDSFSEFKDEKDIERVALMAILEDVLKNALKKKYGSDDNFDIIVNPDKGDCQVFRNRIVVADGEVEDDNAEISLSEARKIEADFEVGEEVSEEVKLEGLDRRAILALRQNLYSKVTEHDNTSLYKQFKDLVGEIYSAEVHHARPKIIILMDEGKNEIVLPKEKQIPSDFFRKGDTVRGIIEAVELKGSKPQIVMSRTSSKFLEKLFEQEIPEIESGEITIKRVVRIPGEKAKVAVDTYDDRIDPVGACVGVKGSRIHGIVRELGNENIDVINYTENTELFIKRALAPARINKVVIDENAKKANVYLDLEEVSRAIGRGGQNIKLAGMLTGYDIDVMRELDPEDDDVELREFKDEIEAWVIEEFSKIGLDTAKSVLNLGVEELVKRTDLEEETVLDVIRILKEEFED